MGQCDCCKVHLFRFDEYVKEENLNKAMEAGMELIGLLSRHTAEILLHISCTISAIRSCASACTALSIPLSSIFQSMRWGSHTPLFWIIFQENLDFFGRHSLVKVLLEFTHPLSSVAREDAYRACISIEGFYQGQRFFETLRSYQSPTAPLYGGLIPKMSETFAVYNSHYYGPFQSGFVLEWVIPRFRERMRMAGVVGCEFIAQGRIWSVAFRRLSTDLRIPVNNYIYNGPGQIRTILVESWVFRIINVKPSFSGATLQEGYLSIKPMQCRNNLESIFRRNKIKFPIYPGTVVPIHSLADLEMEKDRIDYGNSKLNAHWIPLDGFQDSDDSMSEYIGADGSCIVKFDVGIQVN
ncbi:hypothetical protein M422DRAFT_48887 [Sphaerobolus stellatus SS14]|uniref:Unplaced genomic scaffold SPHSTscaffold_64, whole genome shotgun sequence n=1 Tax=Sphaerobolus stellatus (strain SS14) TaxID=990650 RepID=A0A0C9VSS9_SPHS4|nr:hypothetical protein M422DRAFT_48887 [Sphaerobolus stellatus SS14]